MRKGFTMIELIFVIVILGVLASVAIPRLAATRDDAEVAKAATNLTTAVGDIAAYYTAQGDFKKQSTGNTRTAATLSDMTNALDEVNQLTGYIKVKNVKCLKVTAADGTATASANIQIAKETTNTDNACTNLTKLSGIKNMCGTQGANNAQTAKLPCTIYVGSSNVNF